MLKQRVITAIVLLALLLPALFAPSAWPFALLTLLLIGAAGWEWGRLNGAAATAIVMGGLLAVACAAALWAGWNRTPPAFVWWLASAVWVLGGSLALRRGPLTWPRAPTVLRWLLGLALACARTVGVNFVLSVMCLVWVADIAAYAGGRTFGRRKLAPTISPGKSWEGAISGAIGALLLAGLWLLIDTSFKVDSLSLFMRLYDRFGGIGLVASVVFLAAMSVVGDLFESLVKRSAGAKDSSALLPGHGGVLDRIDALLPVFPIAMAFCSV
jgi:phosphatidate cytidylyltransferase